MFYHTRQCRACEGTDLVPVLDLGIQPLANDWKKPGEECAGYAPLKVLFCRKCTLAQLSVVVRPAVMYAEYPYVTSKAKMMFGHFELIGKHIERESLNPPEKWLEIGSNDGTFLAQLPAHEKNCLGFEPASNLAQIANKKGVKTINRFFDSANAIELGATGYRADVVVARHVFAHIDDWRGFVHALEFVTHEASTVFIEVPWVGDMLRMNSWDQIYHEHLSYVSIASMNALLEGSQFYLANVKPYEIHGGVVGFFLRRCDSAVPAMNPDWHSEFEEKHLEEQWKNLHDEKYNMASMLGHTINHCAAPGAVICGFGASAKATGWLNTIWAGADRIRFVCDSTPQKQGCLVPGTKIPVVSEDRLMDADYAINFAWNFHAEISYKYKAFTDKGGKWILPVPTVKVVE